MTDLTKYIPELPFKLSRLLYRDTVLDQEIGQVVLRYMHATAKHLHAIGDQFQSERQLSDGNKGALRKRAVDRLLREHRDRIESELSDLMKTMKISVSETEVLDALGRRPEDGWRDAVAAKVSEHLKEQG